MHSRNRIIWALLAASLASLMAGAAVAGNYAEVGYTDGMDAPPTAGEEREIRFSLMQHGVTPVDFGQVTLIATMPGAQPVTVAAASLGAGEWAATLTFPTAGDWQLRVTHSEFETPPAHAVSVAEAALSWPASAVPIAGIGLGAVVLVAGAAWLTRRLPRPAVPGTEPVSR
ncbi:MAG TPA: FixH family protein [Candidatus Limnocylindria bacterium]|nr:FixH family protein [Candidatus Limnocylindria bacterium]